ncbi:MAG: hypothetical protein RL210_1162 [Pseudomonadota bacterium]|jgi:diguanylate cyclase (GGDEF)-like protein|nr:hypothetical protein [Pseudomonadota bacterium]
MYESLRTPLKLSLGGLLACLLLYASYGEPKPLGEWKWVDIFGEGGTALMSGLWAILILASRPGGRVTWLLAGGLGAIMLGAWVDCLDEFYRVPAAYPWDNWLESLLTPAGMLLLTGGLYAWRQEQASLNQHLQKRERLLREHRAFDRVTELADADYLRRQIRLEQGRSPRLPCALILLDLDHFHRVNREHGQLEGDRLLQAVSHLLLLNLRNHDLLCRYAGDRFAMLLPETGQAEAERIANHLAAMLGQLTHYPRTGGTPLTISARVACAIADCQAEPLLNRLNQALEPQAARSPGFARVIAGQRA